MQLIFAAFVAVVFLLTGYGLSIAKPKGHETQSGKEVERDRDNDQHKDRHDDRDKDRDGDKDDDKGKDEDKEKATKAHEGDRESDKRSDRKHGLDRADEVAGQHGKHGRDNARRHRD